MQVDFYQLSRDPVELVAARLAEKAVATGARLVIVSAHKAQRDAISKALWSREGAFLANGEASDEHAGQQSVLLSETCGAANGASLILIADGVWREEAADFARAFLVFGEEQTEEARGLWSRLSGGEHRLRIFKQRANGAWREGR